MTRTLTPSLLGLLTLLASCAANPKELKREADPALVSHERAMQLGDAERRDFRLVLVRLDQALDSYSRALSARGEPRADAMVERLDRTIRDLVLDQGTHVSGAVAKNQPQKPPGSNFAKLQAAAVDASAPEDQAIAVAALGFSGMTSQLPVLLSAAQSEQALLVDRAVFALAILRAPETPPALLARVMENAQHPEAGRVQAAWALVQLQGVVQDREPILAIWRRLLATSKEQVPAGVLVSAVRGLGAGRVLADADLAAAFLSNPVPRVRMAACIALARLNGQTHAGKLIDLLGPQETVQNVRLHARKALADLAGGSDFGYDQRAWQKAFQRS